MRTGLVTQAEMENAQERKAENIKGLAPVHVTATADIVAWLRGREDEERQYAASLVAADFPIDAERFCAAADECGCLADHLERIMNGGDDDK